MQNLNIHKSSSLLFSLILFALIIRIIAIDNLSLIAEEAYYWNYANHLDFSYFDHPPMVAYLIKLSTIIFGTNEFAVRLPALICSAIAGIYIFKLSENIYPKTGMLSLLLFSILPFFFVQSIIMTPDLPLIAAWAASLYYLFQALVQEKPNAWYKLGLSFGIGLLSKYTIVILLPATLIYLLISKNIKKLLSPRPYIALAIALLIFTPVIYWNANHAWVSFIFQSTRRFNSGYEFSLHKICGLLILFLTPLGIFSFGRLYGNSSNKNINLKDKKFIQIYTIFPLIFFAIFSILHETKFNWIGPGLLAIIPWLAIEAVNISNKLYTKWRHTAITLLVFYTAILICIMSGRPSFIYNAFFSKFYDWDNFYHQIQQIADDSIKQNHKELIIVPLDKYNIASELSFYQAKHHKNKLSIYGRNVFGQDALMYNYWYTYKKLINKNILIIHNDRYMLDAWFVKSVTTPVSPVKVLWGVSQGKKEKTNKFYYQIVKKS